MPYRQVYVFSEFASMAVPKYESAVVRSHAELVAYLTKFEMPAQPPPFELDFDRETGLIITPGSQPDTGTQVRLTTLTEEAEQVIVRFSAYGLGGGATISVPFLVIAIAKTERPIDIQKDQPCIKPPDRQLDSCR